jgi:hypothetical protein
MDYENILILSWDFHLFYRTTDIKKFYLAVKLAFRHGVPFGEVAARHFTSLLLSTEEDEKSELVTRLLDPQLTEHLKTSQRIVRDR